MGHNSPIPACCAAFLMMLVALATVGLWTSCEGKRTIVNALDEKESNEILVFLSSKGIDAEKVRSSSGQGPGGGGLQLFDIAVSSSNATEAMAILNMNGLPRRRGQNLLGLFQSGGLVPSELEQKVRYEAGLAEQIASTIRKIDGILDADLQLSFPEEDPLNPGVRKGTVRASVYVKHQGVLDDPNTHLVTKIKRLVASSINDLEFDNVTVISDKARFSDMSAAELRNRLGEKERTFVKVWTIVLAKESVSRFRTLFFSLTTLLLLCLLTLSWTLWKVYPLLIQGGGGLMSLFSAAPLLGGTMPARPAEATSSQVDLDEDEDEDEDDEEEDNEEEDDDEGQRPEVS